MSRSLLFALSLAALSATTLAAQAPRDIPFLVDAEWLADHLDVEELVVLHVDQQRATYDQGHIPGAHFLPYDRIVAEVDGVPAEVPPIEQLLVMLRTSGVHNDAYVVFYGAPLLAARAWMTLDYMGLGDRAAILDGGLDAWKAAGYELSTGETPVRTGTLSSWPQRDRIVDASEVVRRLEDPSVVLIDARSPDEYTGADGGRNGQFLAGHIPGARHLFWEDLMISRTDTRLLPEEQLRARFEAVGATPDRVLVIYCATGARASVAYFVSRMLGYETRLYDGSWFDWSARGLPAETGPDPLTGGG
jgi:thiosulfate/3-mercaptopyruvate sulfurtransferase